MAKDCKDELKVGRVVEVKDAFDGTISLALVLKDENEKLILSGESYWNEVSGMRSTITKIYSCANHKGAHIISTENRMLVWEIAPAKKMTITEIENVLGYKIEVVK